jgi:DNA-binding HxlR family transcriptional regulator
MEPTESVHSGVSQCRAREVFERVGDKWSVSVIHQLGSSTRRFTDLRQSIDGISQRMLTVTLRGLERDGIVTRTVHSVMPPRVDYALTPMGRTLLTTVASLVSWADAHLDDISQARVAYDRRVAPCVEGLDVETLDAAALPMLPVQAASEAGSEVGQDHVGH